MPSNRQARIDHWVERAAQAEAEGNEYRVRTCMAAAMRLDRMTDQEYDDQERGRRLQARRAEALRNGWSNAEQEWLNA